MKRLNIFYTALGNVLRYRLRSIVVILCLLSVLLPFITAIAIQEGVKEGATVSVEEGADVYVTLDMFGRNGMIPMEMAREFEGIDGVTEAVPRVISRLYVGGRLAVLLGLPAPEFNQSLEVISGSFPKEDEVVIGKGLSDALGLGVGDNLSVGVRVKAIIDHRPYIEKKVFRISGIFDKGTGIWSSDLIVMDIDEAVAIYEMEGFVSDIAVYVRPGYESSVAEEIQKLNAYFRIQTKGLARTYVERGFNQKGGMFVTLYTVAFAISIPAILVVSGFGLSERRREIGVMRATGWLTTEVLQMVFFENIILALISAPLSLVLSYLWVKLFNGFFIAQIFIAEIGSIPPFDIPARFMPLPLMLSFFFALVLTMSGSIYSTWRASIVPPAEAMR